MKDILKGTMERFEKEFYDENDALFDRQGNNVSQQVKSFIHTELSSALKEQLSDIRGKIPKKKNYMRNVSKEYENGFYACIDKTNSILDEYGKEER